MGALCQDNKLVNTWPYVHVAWGFVCIGHALVDVTYSRIVVVATQCQP
jgi:hypothetical protein